VNCILMPSLGELVVDSMNRCKVAAPASELRPRCQATARRPGACHPRPACVLVSAVSGLLSLRPIESAMPAKTRALMDLLIERRKQFTREFR
jgi:hypothetical protein